MNLVNQHRFAKIFLLNFSQLNRECNMTKTFAKILNSYVDYNYQNFVLYTTHKYYTLRTTQTHNYTL